MYSRYTCTIQLLYPEIGNSGENTDVKYCDSSLRFLAVIMLDESAIDTMFCQLRTPTMGIMKAVELTMKGVGIFT